MLLVVLMLILLLLLLALDSTGAIEQRSPRSWMPVPWTSDDEESWSRKRRSEEAWITGGGELRGQDKFIKMHALVVKDENVPESCRVPADKVTKSRYFMCSGVVMSVNHVLTSASCVNQALINEYEIHADLAVLIGALSRADSYVIKISHYETHPRYPGDPDSINYAKNNVAVLTLSCPILRRSVVIPRLPRKLHEDVGHLCSGDECKLFTVVVHSDNHHVLRKMKVRHVVPPPGHENLSVSKREASSSTESKNWTSNPERTEYLDRSKSGVAGLTGVTKGPKRDETPTSIDWTRVGKEITQNRVGTETREKLVGFMKNTLSDLMTKILEIMAVYISDLENIFPRILKTLEENSVVDSDDLNQVMSDSIGRTMMVFALNKLNIASVGKPAVKDEPGQSYQPNRQSSIDVSVVHANRSMKEIIKTNVVIKNNVYCPPLGSPVIINNTLVALIAYTCDDVQNWVEWRYVDIVRNVHWIRKEMKRNLTDIVDNVSSYTMYNGNYV